MADGIRGKSSPLSLHSKFAVYQIAGISFLESILNYNLKK
jgi:hypothetical protein